MGIRAGLTIAQELQQIPGSIGSPTANCNPCFPAAPPSLITNTLRDVNVQGKAEMLLASWLIASISEGQQTGTQESKCQAYWYVSYRCAPYKVRMPFGLLCPKTQLQHAKLTKRWETGRKKPVPCQKRCFKCQPLLHRAGYVPSQYTAIPFPDSHQSPGTSYSEIRLCILLKMHFQQHI